MARSQSRYEPIKPVVLRKLVIAFGFSSSLFLYHIIISPFFPNSKGCLGHDYQYFLPRLLDNYIWIEKNGFLSIRWFTPSFCGGIPSFGNPQDMYFSVPQIFNCIMDPVKSVHLTILFFAMLGFLGMYYLLRNTFGTSPFASFLGGLLFMLNGCYLFRMVIGHLTFHAFMLIPGIAALLFMDEVERRRKSRCFWSLSAGVLGLSYMTYSGMIVHLAIPAGLIFVVIGLLAQLKMGVSLKYWSRLGFAVILSLGISMSKLCASFSFLKNFTRTLYPVPGFKSIVDLILGILQTVFFFPNDSILMAKLTNAPFRLGQHEWEYGVGFFPLLVFIFYVFCILIMPQERNDLWKKVRESRWVILALFILLLMPVILNFQSAASKSFIKSVPVLGSHSRFIHWFSVYIPVTIIASLVLLERVRIKRKWKKIFFVFGIVITFSGLFFHPNSFYHQQPYNPKNIEKTWHKVREGLSVRIERIDFAYGEDAFTQGASSLPCYEPIFGYRLEKFPSRTLKFGDITNSAYDCYNFNNPTCFLFPKENRCVPGDCFSISQSDLFEKFRSFEAFPFELPVTQHVSNIIS